MWLPVFVLNAFSNLSNTHNKKQNVRKSQITLKSSNKILQFLYVIILVTLIFYITIFIIISDNFCVYLQKDLMYNPVCAL